MIIDEEKDANQKCKKYDNGEFKNCTASFVENLFDKKVGCIPPWFTDDETKWCNNTIDAIQTLEIRKAMSYLNYKKNYDGNQFH